MVHFSSASNEWETPQNIFDRLDKIFRFTLDPCCTNETAKCDFFFTQEDNGLTQDWSKDSVFMNPPYGREIIHWMKKAYDESLKGALVVCLVPARTDTKWWNEYAKKGTIFFIQGRLKFNGHKTGAPFPSAIIIFGDFFTNG